MASECEYNLTTKARRKVLGNNNQLDEGAGRHTWNCHDLLICGALTFGLLDMNCVALNFKKHDTWVHTWTWELLGTCRFSRSLDFGHKCIAMAVITHIYILSTSSGERIHSTNSTHQSAAYM